MSMFGGPKMGTWSVRSYTDRKWNKSGRSIGLCCAGGPKEMDDWIQECKEKYGEPPADATASFVKD